MIWKTTPTLVKCHHHPNCSSSRKHFSAKQLPTPARHVPSFVRSENNDEMRQISSTWIIFFTMAKFPIPHQAGVGPGVINYPSSRSPCQSKLISKSPIFARLGAKIDWQRIRPAPKSSNGKARYACVALSTLSEFCLINFAAQISGNTWPTLTAKLWCCLPSLVPLDLE